jgi:basic amino acid/polyamine antiporter, APA family
MPATSQRLRISIRPIRRCWLHATVLRVSEHARDTGLVRAVGPWGLAASIVNIVVGAGIFAVPGALAACVGPYAPFTFLVCAVAIGSVAICFAEGGSRVPTSGGVYGYIDAAFGPFAGYVAGILLWFGNVLACGGVAAALADVAVSVLPPRFVVPVHAAVIIAVIGGIAMINVGGVVRGARLVGVVTVLKLIPLLIFVIVGATAMHSANFHTTTQSSTAGLGRALILALFAFSGMETPLSASGEVAQPARTIPRALAMAMLSMAVLYIAIQAIAQGILGDSLAQSTVPLADAMARVSPWLRVLMLIGAAVSMFGWIGSDILGSPRMLFAFARDGMLPRALARLHERSHAPHVAILCYAAIAIGLALSGTFAELAVLSMLAGAVLYIGGCTAAWRLARRGVALAGTPLNFRWLGAAATIGVASMLVMIALASRAEIIGLVAVIGLSTVIYRLLALHRLARG